MTSRRITGLIEYFFILIIILDFNTPYAKAIDRSYYFPEILMIVGLILLLIRMSESGLKVSTFKKWVQLFAILFGLQFIVFANSVETGQRFSFFSRFYVALPVFSLICAQYASKGELYILLKKYSKIMTVIAVISLFFWIFGSQMHLISPNGYIRAYWGLIYRYPSYYGVYVERQDQTFLWFSGLRNQGIFCEAPMYNFCLAIAIAFELFINNGISLLRNSVNNKKSFTRLIILIITMITTISTTGLITLVLMLITTYILRNPKTRFLKIVKLFTVGFVVFIGLSIAIYIFRIKSISGSWQVRADDFKAGFRAWLSSPIYGTGYNSYTGIDLFRATFRFAGGKKPAFSNSIMQVLAQGGIVLSLIYFIPLFGGILKSFKAKKYNICAFGFVILLEFVFTIASYTFLMLFLLAVFNGILMEGFHEKASNRVLTALKIPG